MNKLLEREQDTEAPKLKIIMFESLVAVYSSLLLHAFVFYDSTSLWRLLSKEWNEHMWNRLFGGGCLTEYRYKTSTSHISLDDENAKQRMRMNAKLGHRLHVGQSASNANNNSNNANKAIDEKVYKREHFVPPDISMINYFLNKVLLGCL